MNFGSLDDDEPESLSHLHEPSALNEAFTSLDVAAGDSSGSLDNVSTSSAFAAAPPPPRSKRVPVIVKIKCNDGKSVRADVKCFEHCTIIAAMLEGTNLSAKHTKLVFLTCYYIH